MRFHSNASINVASGATLVFDGALNLTGFTLTKTGAGEMSINNRLTTSGGTVDIQEGTVSGQGTVGGDLFNNGGTISPGNGVSSTSVVPEPAALLLAALGLLGLFGLVRRRE